MRRLGCGCLSTLFLVAFLVAGTAWMAQGVFQSPDLSPVSFAAADGVRAQQKVFDLVGRSASPRTSRSVVLTEREINAFLARHLAEVADIPVMGAIAHLDGNGVFDLAVRLPTRIVLAETPIGGILDVSPTPWGDRLLWLRLRARARVEPAMTGSRRFLRLDVERFYLGRTRLPAIVHRLFLSPMTLRLLSWPLPAGIDDVKVEREHVVIKAGG